MTNKKEYESPKTLKLVSIIIGDSIQCDECKEKWFDSYWETDDRKICLNCGDEYMKNIKN